MGYETDYEREKRAKLYDYEKRLNELRESEKIAERADGDDFGLLVNLMRYGDVPESVIQGMVDVSNRRTDHLSYTRDEIERLERGGPDALDESSSSNNSSGCFIATAVYGTPFCKELDTLRGFRDKGLKTNPVGNLFVKTYYKVSPPIANFIRERYAFRKAVKDLIVQPAVNFVKKYDLS